MIMMNVPFSPPDIRDCDIEEVARALRSGWITTGPRTKQFEENIAQYVGSSRACCFNSQTACAEMALRMMEIGEGDEVITTSYTYTATASVICHVGAKPVLIDTQKDSIEMDYDALEKAVSEKTKAVIPVDIAGIPCNYDRIFDIVESKKHLFKPSGEIQNAIGRVIVLADTAHALGASRKNVMCGLIGDFSAFSFHAVKNLTTAEGGALTWRHIDGIDDEEIYKKLQLFSLHGQNKDALAKSKLGSWEYDVIGTWYKCNMTDIAAALGLKQLERYPELLERRKQIITYYNNRFTPEGIMTLDHYNDVHSSSGHLYMTRVPGINAEQRNELIRRMNDIGVATNVHYKPLPMHTAYKNLGFDINDYPNAYAYFENEITLPLHTCLTDEQVEYVADSFIKTVKEFAR